MRDSLGCIEGGYPQFLMLKGSMYNFSMHVMADLHHWKARLQKGLEYCLAFIVHESHSGEQVFKSLNHPGGKMEPCISSFQFAYSDFISPCCCNCGQVVTLHFISPCWALVNPQHSPVLSQFESLYHMNLSGWISHLKISQEFLLWGIFPFTLLPQEIYGIPESLFWHQ